MASRYIVNTILGQAFLFLLLVLLLATTPALAIGNTSLIAREGVDALTRLEFAQAEQYFARLEKEYPGYHLTGFLQASVDWTKAESEQNRGHEKAAWKRAKNKLEVVIRRAEKELKQNPDDPDWQLTLGNAKFFLARVYVEQKDYLDTYFTAREARDILRKLVAEHPETYDAYFALGVYEYVAGSVPRGVRWLAKLFDFGGNRELGIRYLRLATEQAPVMAPEAARMLMAAASLQPELMEEPCQYLALSRETHQLYRENPHFSGIYQMLHLNCGYPREALIENQYARDTQLQRFPKMLKVLNIIEVFAHRSEKNLGKIMSMKPVFSQQNSAYWHLAMAQTYDLLGQRSRARKHYYVISYSGMEDEPDVLHNSDNEDWILDQVDRNLKIPYTLTPAYNIDPDNSIKLLRLTKN